MLRRWWRIHPLGTLGTGGVLLTLLELDRLGAPPPDGWRSHREVALSLLNGLPGSRFETDTAFDVLSGVTGLIGPLLGLADPGAEALAIQAGDHLLGRQLDGGGWPQSSAVAVRNELLPLTGFSHGTAGMASALCALHRRTREPRFLAGALRAIAYERACFDAERRNWPYYLSSNTDPVFMATWCHGAPGIALSRLCFLGTPFEDERLTRELKVALETTSETTLSQDHLCCGTMGLVTILRLASQRLGEPHWHEAADRLETEAISRVQRSGHFRAFGTRDGSLVMPGSMTGLSGIGLALLHSAPADACLAQLLTAGLW
jgi:lantibiotic modifying enzyme